VSSNIHEHNLYFKTICDDLFFENAHTQLQKSTAHDGNGKRKKVMLRPIEKEIDLRELLLLDMIVPLTRVNYVIWLFTQFPNPDSEKNSVGKR
jgi:hypothetical protein